MKRPSYREAIAETVAIHGGDFEDDSDANEGLVGVYLVASIFSVDQSKVVKDCLRYMEKNP